MFDLDMWSSERLPTETTSADKRSKNSQVAQEEERPDQSHAREGRGRGRGRLNSTLVKAVILETSTH